MPTRARSKMFFLALLLPTLTLFIPQPGSAEVKKWDQEAVTELAAKLTEKVNGLRKDIKRGPGSSMASMQEYARYEFMDTLRLIESEAGYLARRLRDGEGQEETSPVYQRLQRLVRSAADTGKRLFIDESTQQKIDKAGAVLDELAAHYEPPKESEAAQ